jgi:hypothetical protein
MILMYLKVLSLQSNGDIEENHYFLRIASGPAEVQIWYFSITSLKSVTAIQVTRIRTQK